MYNGFSDLFLSSFCLRISLMHPCLEFVFVNTTIFVNSLHLMLVLHLDQIFNNYELKPLMLNGRSQIFSDVISFIGVAKWIIVNGLVVMSIRNLGTSNQPLAIQDGIPLMMLNILLWVLIAFDIFPSIFIVSEFVRLICDSWSASFQIIIVWLDWEQSSRRWNLAGKFVSLCCCLCVSSCTALCFYCR